MAVGSKLSHVCALLQLLGTDGEVTQMAQLALLLEAAQELIVWSGNEI